MVCAAFSVVFRAVRCRSAEGTHGDTHICPTEGLLFPPTAVVPTQDRRRGAPDAAGALPGASATLSSNAIIARDAAAAESHTVRMNQAWRDCYAMRAELLGFGYDTGGGT
jgi:hypothetical protein